VISRWHGEARLRLAATPRGVSTLSDSAELVVRNFLASWRRSDVDEMVSFINDDAVYTDGPRGTHHGIDAIKTELQDFVKTIPSTIIEFKTLVSEGGTVMLERVDHFEIQGKPFVMEVAAVFEVDGNGRINRWRDYYDLRSIEDQVAEALAPPT
jgi:limonene-1,2-epoxide hydrolase